MTIEIKFPSDRKDIALAIGQALIAIGQASAAFGITAKSVGEAVASVEKFAADATLMPEKTAEPKGPFYWVHHESESYGVVQTHAELMDQLDSGDGMAEGVSPEVYRQLVAEWTGDESPNMGAPSATDPTGSGAGSASAGGVSDGPLDENKVPFNDQFCGKATVPFYGSGKKKGQWKKRQGVDEAAYDNWYAAALKAVKAAAPTKTSAAEASSDSNLAAAAFGARGNQHQQQATGGHIPQDAGQLMKWVSEQQAAGNINQQQVTDAYRALNLPFDAIMNPAYPIAQNCAAIYNHLSQQVR